MKFMNTWDIDEACQKHAAHAIKGPAARLLRDLRDLADSVSDGWCYWPKPCRAAKLLMQLVEDNESPTASDLKRAVAPIKAFMTREAKHLKGKTLTMPC